MLDGRQRWWFSLVQRAFSVRVAFYLRRSFLRRSLRQLAGAAALAVLIDLVVLSHYVGAVVLAFFFLIMAADHVEIEVELGTGGAEATVYGCDLSADYVRINADYTT